MSEDESFVMRRASVADIPELLRQRRAMFVAMAVGDESQLHAMERSFEAFLPEALERGIFNAWLAVAERSHEVLGGGAVVVNPWPPSPTRLRPRRADILNVIVYPPFRRRGIARRLMETMIAWCRAEDFNAVALHASADGRALYEQLGFVPTNEMRLELG